MRIRATDAAVDAVRAVAGTGRTDLMIVLASGCCDSTAAYLYDRHLAEPGSVTLGDVGGVPVVASPWLAGLTAPDDELVLDAVPTPADDSLSLETDLGLRLVLRAGTAGEPHGGGSPGDPVMR